MTEVNSLSHLIFLITFIATMCSVTIGQLKAFLILFCVKSSGNAASVHSHTYCPFYELLKLWQFQQPFCLRLRCRNDPFFDRSGFFYINDLLSGCSLFLLNLLNSNYVRFYSLFCVFNYNFAALFARLFATEK